MSIGSETRVMTTLRAASLSAGRVALFSTLIALFWTGMAVYWNRETPPQMTRIVLVFVVVWLCSLPITVGSEIDWLLVRHFAKRATSRPTAGQPASEAGREDTTPR